VASIVSAAPRGHDGTSPAAGPPIGPQRRRRRFARPRRSGRWLRRAVIAAGAVITVVGLLAGVALVGAVRTPGNDPFKAKLADWLRDHGGSGIVTSLENVYFDHQQPAKGGTPAGLNSVPVTEAPASTPAAPTPTTATSPIPADIAPIVSPPLAGEGHWTPTGPAVAGRPGIYVAQFRADDQYTSQITSAVWIDPAVLRVRLVPGSREPGGQWSVPPAVVGDATRTIAAAFNGGFRFHDAKGGFYFDGREAVPLTPGAASVVIYRDGHLDIRAWDPATGTTPDVEGVLQNLTLLVDNGQIDPAVSHNDTRAWGATLKGSIAVARSGIGITARGELLYVAGPALTARSLAESLQRAGAVRGMTLDINPEWVTFNLYEHPDPADPLVVTGAKLYPDMQRPGDRYLSAESRDFFTVSTQ
jgi:hypothetical protein